MARPKGARNKRTLQREKASDAALKKALAKVPNSFDGDSHALLQLVYRDPRLDWPLRLDAAKAAIRFEKPSLAAIEHTGKDGESIKIEHTDADRARALAAFIAKTRGMA